ncbi:transmembrane protein [Spiroplasma sabaudiense Ar-1343]|uniref:Transmembrane protein n=1 Tax=Spiroplasma sabaudiense Ar-1343 TaxID=1276257 RepID=W6A9J9_9MOLU|nr:hypothetical protein [Spiroplasma sabaudiense]AHI53661.1 transmembrane protein [Spiroplasma sabaudiense Ar-1343]
MSSLNNDKKRSKISIDNSVENNIDHDVPFSPGKTGHSKKDHYHEEHHFTASGSHDDVSLSDFSIKNHFTFNKRNLTFKIALTSIFLGLAIISTLIDALSETLLSIPIYGVKMNIRILDLLVTIVSIPTLGLIFSELIAFLIPWIHFGIHSDHSPIQIAFDMIAYMSAVFIFWAIFYVLFKNSIFHKHPNKKVDNIKRWIPGVVIIPLVAAIATGLFILALYVASLSGTNSGHTHSHDHSGTPTVDINDLVSPRHANHAEEGGHHHDHENEASWSNIQNIFWPFVGGVFGIQLARFMLFYVVFAIVEERMKPINHRYR